MKVPDERIKVGVEVWFKIKKFRKNSYRAYGIVESIKDGIVIIENTYDGSRYNRKISEVHFNRNWKEKKVIKCNYN